MDTPCEFLFRIKKSRQLGNIIYIYIYISLGDLLVHSLSLFLGAPRLAIPRKPLPALGSFVDALLISCQVARDAVNSAGVWDDEDPVFVHVTG